MLSALPGLSRTMPPTDGSGAKVLYVGTNCTSFSGKGVDGLPDCSRHGDLCLRGLGLPTGTLPRLKSWLAKFKGGEAVLAVAEKSSFSVCPIGNEGMFIFFTMNQTLMLMQLSGRKSHLRKGEKKSSNHHLHHIFRYTCTM